MGAARACIAVLALLSVGQVLSGMDSTAALSRQKRYLHFPFGSTLRVALSSKWATVFDPRSTPTIWTQGINWGITYDLPNGTQLFGPSGLGRAAARRGRRDLYRRLQTAIDSAGFPGEPCLLRAICEAPQALPSGSNVIAEFLRIILWYPPDGVDGPPMTSYDLAQHSGKRGQDCVDIYRDCPVSVLGLLLSLRPSQ